MSKEQVIYYEKLSPEEAEKQLHKLVTIDMRFDEEAYWLKKKRNEKWPDYNMFDPPKGREFKKLDTRLQELFHKQSLNHSKIYDLTRTVPVPKNKRSCSSCFYGLCRKHSMCCDQHLNDAEYYCDEYRQQVRTSFEITKAHFMTPEERAIEDAKTFEDKVNDRVQRELETYKDTLKVLDEYLAKVPVENTKILPQNILDEYEKGEQQIAESLGHLEQAYTRKTVKLFKSKDFKGIKFYSYKFNPKKYEKIIAKAKKKKEKQKRR